MLEKVQGYKFAKMNKDYKLHKERRILIIKNLQTYINFVKWRQLLTKEEATEGQAT